MHPQNFQSTAGVNNLTFRENNFLQMSWFNMANKRILAVTAEGHVTANKKASLQSFCTFERRINSKHYYEMSNSTNSTVKVMISVKRAKRLIWQE
jgi:hypothetical protein